MKAKIALLVITGILLTSCGAEVTTQELEVVTNTPAIQASATQESITQEPVVTEEFVAFVATEPPTEVPTDPSKACITLLAPEKDVDLPATGKVTFSWTPVDGAESYALNFVLPSGVTASFETNQTSRDRYMEAFVSGGEYQWQVVAQNADGSKICVSKVSSFHKPAYEKPKDSNGRNDGGDNANNESGGVTGGDEGGNDGE